MYPVLIARVDMPTLCHQVWKHVAISFQPTLLHPFGLVEKEGQAITFNIDNKWRWVVRLTFAAMTGPEDIEAGSHNHTERVDSIS